MSIDWMENQRDKDKPFVFWFITRRFTATGCPSWSIWMNTKTKPSLCLIIFDDDYEGRPAAAAFRKWVSLRIWISCMIPRCWIWIRIHAWNRLIWTLWTSDTGRAQTVWWFWDAPLIKEFYQKNPQGKELADWKFQRYMRDYAKVVKTVGW